MSSGNQQIVTAYEDSGFTIEQIAEAFGYEAEAIQLVLMQCSPLYRKQQQGEGKAKETFTDTAYEAAIMTMEQMCQYAEIEAVRYRAAEFIINEKKGRNDLKAAKGLGGGVTLVQINMQMQRAKEALAKSRRTDSLERSANDDKLLRGEAIEVESTTIVSAT